MNSKGELFVLNGRQPRILRFTPEGQFKDFLTPEGVPAPATFIPRSFKIGENDHIYVLDILGARVLVFNVAGKYERHIAFPKDFGFFSDMAADPRGTVLLVDSVRGMVWGATKDAGQFTPLTKSLKGYLSFPTSITTDERGMIYLVDENGSGIVVLGQEGNFMGRLLSMGWTEGLLYYPSQMSLNDKGEVFIADRGNSRVQVFNVTR